MKILMVILGIASLILNVIVETQTEKRRIIGGEMLTESLC